jgi:hypothetical protein
VITQASGCAAQTPCSTQPVVAILDSNVGYFNLCLILLFHRIWHIQNFCSIC